MNDIEKRVEDVLTRGVGEFIDPDGAFREKLLKKARGEYDKPIIIKYGIDPTRPDIHLGHAVCFRKLREFQDLGCKVVFLVGDYTAMIGDPTGKSKARPMVEFDRIRENTKSFIDQLGAILNVGDKSDSDFFSWITNSDWYFTVTDLIVSDGVNVFSGKDDKQIDRNSIEGKAEVWKESRMQINYLKKKKIESVSFSNLLYTLRHISHAQLLERDMFQERKKKNEPLFMNEMLYPVFQGIDSLVLGKVYGSCDLELGGTDQTFNMLMGRNVMEIDKQNPQSTLSIRILEGTDGKEKMSKSLGNYISIAEEPGSIFGKVMSLPDSSIVNYFELCTDASLREIDSIKKGIESGDMNPRDAKLRLGQEIVKIYHGEEASREARERFVLMFSKREIPSDIREVKLTGEMSLLDFLVREGFATSRGDARRKIEQGGVEVDGVKVLDRVLTLTDTGESTIVRCCKKDFARVIF